VLFIPTWVTNILLLITCFLSIYQHLRLRRQNPIANLQFFMVVFALAVWLINTLYGRENPRLSLALFVISVASLAFMIRQLRMLPPSRPFD
jgi:hypothetical protein